MIYVYATAAVADDSNLRLCNFTHLLHISISYIMALPTQLGNYVSWSSPDILNRFKDGSKPTVADWEALRQYMYPMLTQTEAQQHYAGLKTILDTYLIQGKVLDTNFFARLFEAEISFNNYPFAAKYIDTHSPFYANNDQCFSVAFANGAKPNGTMFAGYLQALLSPWAFASNLQTGFHLIDSYGSSWIPQHVTEAAIRITVSADVRGYRENTIYEQVGQVSSTMPYTISFPRTCTLTSPYTTVDATLTLICSGRITEVGESVLGQTSVIGLFKDEMNIPQLTQVNDRQFVLTFSLSDTTPIFISTAYTTDAQSEGVATVHILSA